MPPVKPLNIIKKKQRQLLVAARVAETNQSNISIVERGLVPAKTKMTQVLRYGIPLAGGLAAGAFIGAVGLTLLNVLDPRLYVASDIPAASGLGLLGVIRSAAARTPTLAEVVELPNPAARPALLQVLGRLDVLPANAARVIVVTSAENEAGTAGVAIQLAALLARNREGRVLLVDADLDSPALTISGGGETGLIDLLGGSGTPADVIRPTKSPRLAFLGAGRIALRDEVGSTRDSWIRFLGYSREEYRTIIVNAGGLLNSRDAVSLAKAADCTLLVTRRKVSKKDSLARAAALLKEIGTSILGVIHCEARR